MTRVRKEPIFSQDSLTRQAHFVITSVIGHICFYTPTMLSKRRPLPMLEDGYDLLAMTSEERTRLMSLPTGAMKIVRQNATVVICTECKKPGTLQDTMLCSKACEAGLGEIHQIDITF